MPSKGIVVGCVVGVLAVLGFVAAIKFLQLKRSERTPLLQSDWPPEIEATGPDLLTGQASELEAFEEAVRVLERTNEAIAGTFLTPPIEGLLDLVNACSVSSRIDLKPAWLTIPVD